MKFLTLAPGNEDSITLYNGDSLRVKAKFLRNKTKDREVTSIEINMLNGDLLNNSYELENVNLCRDVINGVDLSVLEINLRITDKPKSTYNYTLTTSNFKINNGTFLYSALLIYELGEKNKDCIFSGFGSQPDHKKGNIIIGNP